MAPVGLVRPKHAVALLPPHAEVEGGDVRALPSSPPKYATPTPAKALGQIIDLGFFSLEFVSTSTHVLRNEHKMNAD